MRTIEVFSFKGNGDLPDLIFRRRKKRPLKIFVINCHSVLNSGDSGIVIAQIQFFRKYFSNPSITITSRTPGIDDEFYGSMGIRILSPFTPAPSVFPGIMEKMAQSTGNFLALKSKRDLISQIRKSDLIISSGGGYFWSNRKILPGPMFFQNYLHIKLASILNKPILFFPQSFGPFHNSVAPKMLRNVLQGDNVARIFVREKTSFDLLTDLLGNSYNIEKIRECPDMAFCLKNEDSEGRGEVVIDLPKPRVAITVRDWDFPAIKSRKERWQKTSAYLTALREVCQKIYRMHGGSIVLFAQARGPGNFENDIPITKRFFADLKSSLPQENLLYIDLPASVSPHRIIDILSKVDLIIATRFHSAIFALISGVPAIAVDYQPKSKGVMELLELEHYCVSIDEIEAVQVFHLVGDILRKQTEISGKIREKVRDIRKTINDELKSSIRSFFKRSHETPSD